MWLTQRGPDSQLALLNVRIKILLIIQSLSMQFKKGIQLTSWVFKWPHTSLLQKCSRKKKQTIAWSWPSPIRSRQSSRIGLSRVAAHLSGLGLIFDLICAHLEVLTIRSTVVSLNYSNSLILEPVAVWGFTMWGQQGINSLSRLIEMQLPPARCSNF